MLLAPAQKHFTTQQELYSRGVLGVVSSVPTLMANIQRRVDNFDNYFSEVSLGKVLCSPKMIARGAYCQADMAYLPTFGQPERVTVLAPTRERAKRNLAYKVLRRKSSHGVDFREFEMEGGQIQMSCIPIILDHSM